MSAALGTEARLETAEASDVSPPGPVDRLAVHHARPARPVPRPAVPATPPVAVRRPGRSGPAAWAHALRLPSLPAVLLGPLLAALLVAAEPTAGALPAAAAAVGVVVTHLLAAVLQALRDPDRRRAGPVRRVEAGRALLALVVLGATLTGALVVVRGWPALLVAAAAVAAVVAGVRWAGAQLAAPATAAGALAVWWSATGGLPWRLLLVAAVAAVLVAAVQHVGTSRLLLAAPCVAVGVAVGLHALPWPALLVAAVLPLARRAAVSGYPGAAPARFALVLLVVGLVIALVTGADLPLTAPR